MAYVHIGNATTLAALNAADHSNGDIAYIWLNSWTRKMVLDTSSTKTTDTTNHPYYVQAADTNGTWIEQPGADDPWAFDGSKIATGAIYSTNWSTTEGSEIDLDAGTIKLGGSDAPAFSVTAAGVLTATGANISGAITGSTIDIGGSDDSSFHVDADGNMWLGAAAFNIGTNPFAVSNAGAMRAVSGIIGGLTLSTTALYTGSKTAYNDANAGIHFGTDGIGIGNNIFTVSAAGALVSTSGTIAGLTINATDGLYAGTGATRVQMKPGAAGVGGIWTGHDDVASSLNYLNVDGSGWFAGGNIVWTADGDVTIGDATRYIKYDGALTIDVDANVGTGVGVIYKGGKRWLYDFNPASCNGNNLFLGVEAGNLSMAYSSSADDASYNIGIGYQSLMALTTGYKNIALGTGALIAVTSGIYNIAIGDQTLKSIVSYSSNIAIGGEALCSLTGASNNIAIGDESQYFNVSGANNIGIGFQSLYYNPTGDHNVVIGYASGAGAPSQENSDCVLIGAETDFSGASSNEIVIGYNAIGNGSNTITLGNTSITDLYTSGNIILSDAKYIVTDQIRARDGDGLKLYDDSGAAGIFVEDGGQVGINETAPNQKLTVGGSISLVDQAAAAADTAGYGQIWVSNATPDELWFTDDAGTDTQISSHPQDAPAELYINGPGLDWIGKRVQKYLGVIFWQKIDGTITEETFEAYNLRRKDEPGHVDLVKRDWDTVQLAKLREQKLQEVIETEVALADAFESVEITEEIQTGTKSEGFIYSIDKDEKVIVPEKIIPIMTKQGTGQFEKRLKADVSFDDKTGKFIHKRTMTEAEVDALDLQPPEMPPWMFKWTQDQIIKGETL